MYALYVIAFAGCIITTGLLSTKWNSPVSPANLPTNIAKEVAGNIYADAAWAKRRVEKPPGYISYGQRTKVEGIAINITDDKQNSYLIYSWWKIHDKRVNPADVMGELVNMSSQIRAPYGTTWFVPLVVVNTNCSPKIMNGFLTPIKPYLDGYKRLFTTLCNEASSRGLPVYKYALVIQLDT